MTRPVPSVEELRRLFVYNPIDGVLLRTDGSNPCRKKRGYWTVRIRDRQIYVHNIVWALMTGEYPEHTVDHKDLIRTNNRWDNLRKATQAEQQVNRRLFKNNTSGYRGVYAQNGRYRAMIRFDKKTHHLGTFDDPAEAAKIVQKAREAKWGEFARAA